MPRRKPLEIEDTAFLKALKQIDTESRTDAGRKALNRAGKSVLKRSQKNTPVLEGDVRDSHTLNVHVEGELVHADIDVTDPAAWYVHEQLENRHDDGTAKFLQKAIKSRRGFFQKAIREEMSDLVRDKGIA